MAPSPTRASSAPPNPENAAQPDTKALDTVTRKADSVPPSVSPEGKKHAKTAAQGTPTLKRKLDDVNDTTGTESEATQPEKPVKKRKTAGPTVKKAKPTTPRAKKTGNPGSAGAKGGKMTPSPKQDMSTDPTTAPPPVNTAVANKIKQVKEFLELKLGSVLEHDPANPNHVHVASSLLLGALQLMRLHYQVGRQEVAAYSDANEAIVGK